MSVSLGLLIVRLAVGLLLIGHGAQKLFGWFGGLGFSGAMQNFSSMGFKPAWFWSLLASAGESGGGLLLALGFLNPLGPVIIFADMLMAILKVHWKHGLWGTKGGMEYPLVLLLLSVVLGLVGPGNYSLDTLFRIAPPAALLFGLGVVAAVIVDGIGLLISRQPTSTQHAD